MIFQCLFNITAGSSSGTASPVMLFFGEGKLVGSNFGGDKP
jgi:hypothetical protein